MIRVDAAWFAMEPLDMRAGVDTALARVVSVFGEARAHHAYLFVNKRANRLKVLVHDGFGLWLCARRLYEGSFIRAALTHERGIALTACGHVLSRSALFDVHLFTLFEGRSHSGS
jgi:transposase